METLVKLLESADAFPCSCILSSWAAGLEEIQWQICR